MTFDEINKYLIFDAIEGGIAVVPTPEELKAKFGKKKYIFNANPWVDDKGNELIKTTPIFNHVEYKVKNRFYIPKQEKESLLNQLFEIMRSQL